jgi:DNA-binding NtrC family response regulator
MELLSSGAPFMGTTGERRSPLLPATPEIADGDAARLNLIGESAAFQQCVRQIRRMAAWDATVLIEGETGTGKELAARAIHYLSRRRPAPFIPLNCGALPETLVESELFGHTRGAFTDARETRAGLIAQASGGTLFLDEVEAMGPRAQVALLRFLQDGEYRPLGGSTVRGANVRVIASSNVSLADLVARGAFRSDLLFRLNVLPLRLPALRDRGTDVVLLARTFLRRFVRHYAQASRVLDDASLEWLQRYEWPGNVRELENLIHRQFLMTDGQEVTLVPSTPNDRDAVRAADDDPVSRGTFAVAKRRAIAEFERRYIVALLERAHGNISLASRMSGKERSRLGKLVKKYGLERELFVEKPSTDR